MDQTWSNHIATPITNWLGDRHKDFQKFVSQHHPVHESEHISRQNTEHNPQPISQHKLNSMSLPGPKQEPLPEPKHKSQSMSKHQTHPIPEHQPLTKPKPQRDEKYLKRLKERLPRITDWNVYGLANLNNISEYDFDILKETYHHDNLIRHFMEYMEEKTKNKGSRHSDYLEYLKHKLDYYIQGQRDIENATLNDLGSHTFYKEALNKKYKIPEFPSYFAYRLKNRFRGFFSSSKRPGTHILGNAKKNEEIDILDIIPSEKHARYLSPVIGAIMNAV